MKKSTAVTLVSCFFAACLPAWSCTSFGAGPTLFQAGTDSAAVIRATDYATLNAAVTANSASPVSLSVTTTIAVAATLTVPATFLLHPHGNALISLASGATLTVASSTRHWPLHRIFTGAGTVRLTNGEPISPQWWGAKADGVTDDYGALTAAFDSFGGRAGVVALHGGTYLFGTTLTIPVGVTLSMEAAAQLSTTSSSVSLMVKGNLLLDDENAQVFAGALVTSDRVTWGVPSPVHTVRPQWWGAKADGETDDRIAIQRATDVIGRVGGGIVWFASGVYRISSSSAPGALGLQVSLLLSYSNVTWEGVYGQSKFLIDNAPAAFTFCFYKDPSLTITPPAVVDSMADVDQGTHILTLTTPANANHYAAGDWILIRSGDTLLGTSNPDSEINQVEAVNAGTGAMRLRWPTFKPYKRERYSISNPSYPNFAPIGIVKINDRVFENVRFRNLMFEKTTGGVMLWGRYGVNISIEDTRTRITAPTSFVSYGFGSPGSRFIKIRRNHIEVESDLTNANTASGEFLWPDVTCSDFEVTENTFIGRGYVRFDTTEGMGNYRFSRNTVFFTTDGPGLIPSSWTMMNWSSRNYNFAITDNTFVLAAASKMVFIGQNAQGLEDLIFTGNTVIATNPPTPFAAFLFGFRNTIEGNVWKPDDGTIVLQIEDPGAFATLNTNDLTDMRQTSGIPKREVWKSGTELRRWASGQGRPRGWVNTRTGRSAATWTASTMWFSRWRAGQSYALNTFSIPDDFTGVGHYYKCTVAGVTGANPPLFPTTSGATVTDGSITWQEAGTTTTYRRLAGQYALPTVDNGHVYSVESGGTSGTTEPTWPTTSGATVTDGMVVWKENGASALWRALPNL